MPSWCGQYGQVGQVLSDESGSRSTVVVCSLLCGSCHAEADHSAQPDHLIVSAVNRSLRKCWAGRFGQVGHRPK